MGDSIGDPFSSSTKHRKSRLKFENYRSKFKDFMENLNNSKFGTFQKVNKNTLQNTRKNHKKVKLWKMYRNQSERKSKISENDSWKSKNSAQN